MPDTRYARLCYNMLVRYDSSGCHNWATDLGLTYIPIALSMPRNINMLC